MSFEIEQKYRVNDFDSLKLNLKKLQKDGDISFTPSGEKVQHDIYLNHPSKNFAETGEAFRLRLDNGVPKLTYKGPKLPSISKVRREIELSFLADEKDFASIKDLFLSLDFRFAGEVKKKRSCFHGRKDEFNIELSFDEVESLGKFVEIEIVAQKSDQEQATAILLNLAKSLGLVHLEKKSYLTMCLNLKKKDG